MARIRFVAASLLLICVSCWPGSDKFAADLKRWQLPPDLLERQGQLTELHLPSTVDKLTWLAGERLESLSVHCNNLQSLEGLPPSVVRLDLGNTSIQSLDHLPRSLRMLDIRATPIRQAIGLPDSLQELSLEGAAAANLRFLPATLMALTLRQANAQLLRGFPRALERLTISGGNMESIEGLPESLKRLRLDSTGLRSLPILPRNVKVLELAQNPSLRVPSLPGFLQQLTLDSQRVENLDGLRYLKSLQIMGAQNTSSVPRDLPRSLETFRLNLLDVDAKSLPKLPPSLRNLGLLRWSGPLPSIPDGVRELDLTDYAGERLDLRSYRLQSLSLAGARVQSLQLPATLTALDVSGANADLPGLVGQMKGFKKLKSLRCWECSFSLAELPQTLTELDVSNTLALDELGSLPAKLEILKVSRTAIANLAGLDHLGSLRELDVSNSKITDLGALPAGLVKLVVHVGQLSSLGSLPESVRVLHFVEKEEGSR